MGPPESSPTDDEIELMDDRLIAKQRLLKNSNEYLALYAVWVAQGKPPDKHFSQPEPKPVRRVETPEEEAELLRLFKSIQTSTEPSGTSAAGSTEPSGTFTAAAPTGPPGVPAETIRATRWSSVPKPRPATEVVLLTGAPLSHFGPSIPAILATGIVVAAGVGFTFSRGLASLLSLAVFLGTQEMVARFRQLPGREVPRELARLIDAKHLRECTTWCFTQEGNVEGDVRVLTDFCPGYFLRDNVDPGRGMLSSCLNMAKALDVPSNLKLLIKSDSTLKTHHTPNSGKDWLATKKNKDMFPHIRTVHPYYQVHGETISGGTIRDICNSLPTTQADYDSYDCVIIVVNMNQEKGKKGKVWQDDSDQGVEFMRLCIALRPLKRALIIAGGFGLKWNLSPSDAVLGPHDVPDDRHRESRRHNGNGWP